jgi:hypothetical protein
MRCPKRSVSRRQPFAAQCRVFETRLANGARVPLVRGWIDVAQSPNGVWYLTGRNEKQDKRSKYETHATSYPV